METHQKCVSGWESKYERQLLLLLPYVTKNSSLQTSILLKLSVLDYFEDTTTFSLLPESDSEWAIGQPRFCIDILYRVRVQRDSYIAIHHDTSYHPLLWPEKNQHLDHDMNIKRSFNIILYRSEWHVHSRYQESRTRYSSHGSYASYTCTRYTARKPTSSHTHFELSLVFKNFPRQGAGRVGKSAKSSEPDSSKQ